MDVQIGLHEDALEVLEQLRATDRRIWEQVDSCLETLEADPTSQVVRRHRLRTRQGEPVWVIVVGSTGYSIFWTPGVKDDEVTVWHILKWSPSAR